MNRREQTVQTEQMRTFAWSATLPVILCQWLFVKSRLTGKVYGPFQGTNDSETSQQWLAHPEYHT